MSSQLQICYLSDKDCHLDFSQCQYERDVHECIFKDLVLLILESKEMSYWIQESEVSSENKPRVLSASKYMHHQKIRAKQTMPYIGISAL
jgi:hypothetical protein